MFFLEDEHKYIHKVTGGEYPSVTTILGHYKNKFDSISISEKYVETHPEIQTPEGAKELIDRYMLDMSVDEFLSEPVTAERLRDFWSQASLNATIKGNNFHYTQEIQTIYLETNLPSDYNDHVDNLWTDLADGVYPELRIWHDDYQIAGTIDKVVIKHPYVDIYDYKTNKRVLSKGSDRKKMLYPLHFLNDADYYHYQMQLNIYGYLLELWGYKVRKLEIHHKRFLDSDEVPANYRMMWETPEQVKKLKIIPLEYYPIRIKNFLDYDLRRRTA